MRLTQANNTSPFIMRTRLLYCLALLLPLSFLIAVLFGSVSLSLTSVLDALFNTQHSNSNDVLIIQQIRLPRALLAMLVGCLLAVCGTATQGLFRNPLADPSLIGVTAGASAGAAFSMFLSVKLHGLFGGLNGILGLSFVSVGAFIGSIITVFLVYRLASNQRGTSVATMLLAGIAITAIASGFTSLLQYFSDNDTLRRISLWQMGGFDGANYAHLIIASCVCVLVMVFLPRYSSALNALLLGESEARHLGICVESVKLRLILLVSAGVGTAVALAGTIAFVGLVVPHIMRLLIGPDHRYLLPVSAVAGAILLLLADTFARTIISPTELPVGLVTAFIGAPFFISLLRQRHDFGMQ